ncbi:uncharacterized protein LOC143193662 [Rhynchophorus ferrugineus]|uniref:uncharacterized protein LOC143193662 n=1 Tax=Rhynchophorus ferrugineus TaxID=354439 RepID=UPI003FCCBEDB
MPIHQRSTRFLIDAGADISVLPNSHSSRASPTAKILYSANRTPIKTNRGKRMTLDFNLRSFTWTFVIADLFQTTVGNDFIHEFDLLPDLPYDESQLYRTNLVRRTDADHKNHEWRCRFSSSARTTRGSNATSEDRGTQVQRQASHNNTRVPSRHDVFHPEDTKQIKRKSNEDGIVSPGVGQKEGRAYFNILMAKEDREKTAIITPFGLFEINVMLFRLKNAGQSFQQFRASFRRERSCSVLRAYLFLRELPATDC